MHVLSYQGSSYVHLTGTKLHQINLRGIKVAFISHWFEQSRRYNLIAAEAYTDSVLVNMLNTCLSGTDELRGGLNN